MKISYESFKTHEIFFCILLGEELIPMGPCSVSVGCKAILEPLRSIFENAVSTETGFEYYPQQASLMVYMAEVLWILISGLTYRCHHSFGRHGILDAVS